MSELAVEVEANRSEVVDFLQRLVREPSYSANEGAVARIIKAEMEKLNYDRVEIGGLGNVLGKIGTGPKTLVIDGHIDTVKVKEPDAWGFDPFGGELKAGEVRGRGAADQLGGVAGAVYAGKIIRKKGLLPPDCSLYITGTVQEEECEGACWDYLIDSGKLVPDAVLLTEPSDLTITRGHRGRTQIDVSIAGKGAHGSAPGRGDNPTYRLPALLKEIEKLNSQLEVDDLLGQGSITVTAINTTSASLCSVPSRCQLTLDRRLAGQFERAEIRAEIEDLTAFQPKFMTTEIPEYNRESWTGREVRYPQFFPAWKLEENHPLVEAGRKVYRNIFNSTPPVDRWTFATNGSVLRGRYGIPCIGFGPGKEKFAHARNERIEVDSLLKATEFYAAWPRNYLEELES